MTKYFIPFFILLFSCSGSQPEVYEWRGADRMGIYPDTNLLKEWPEEGPRELWAIDKLGRGFGSPQFKGERFFVTGEVDSMAHLYCFDLDGNKIWQSPLGKEWVSSYPGSRSAPTIVEKLIYIGTGMGDLYCVNEADGSLEWSKDFVRDFQGVYPLHGHSEAAVISGDRVFWTPGGPVHNVVALNRMTGELIWSNPGFGERSGYNPGKLLSHHGRELFVTFTAAKLLGLDAETGELLWSHHQDVYTEKEREKIGIGDSHANSVVYRDGSIFYVAGDGNGGVRLDLSEDGSAFTQAWRNPGFDSFFGGVVLIDNYLYTSGTHRQYLYSIDATTGILRDSLHIGQGALIAADERLYYYNHRGQMYLISHTEGKLKELSSFRINKGSGHHFSHPVIHRGVLYQRRGDALMAFDIRRPAS
ncbi:MAG: PQQ-like beta-propeller repeat protein [Bacteroidales bacterium]|nr:PQQ-like beta-propeller repeat protein [Bacteroidales bacterium]